ncbi:DNA alkylation repair protein [Halobacillus sp. A1]|uniref:DNA alkylation repair protein n=1 Tax=Halobacillus sp. A1 TaxID=2880262 RepID=UPI0020A627D2|nr:DNA alkylation repair protein [Halobacillus sp. A1]MCP3033308.1 DNA alkylation repair protein [Halobacillus sp. A1]
MSKVKDIYHKEFLERLADALHKQSSGFDKERFLSLVYSNDWEQLEFKQRVGRITASMHEALPQPYIQALPIIKRTAPEFEGLPGIVFPDYMAQYGTDDWEESMQALRDVTEFSTSEFAIRSFLLKDLNQTLDQMFLWAEDDNEHVRRLASEGSRPRLPWGQTVPYLKEHPERLLPLLEKLLEDESLYVRRSVANHLNDVTKTHPQLVLDIVEQRKGHNENTDWILRHACRTLLKQGNYQALQLFGYHSSDSLHVHQFTLDQSKISIGDSLSFTFQVSAEADTKLRVEYAIDYVKKNGRKSRKVFQASDTTIKTGEEKSFMRNQSFRNMTTRKHYPGTHTLAIIVNGIEKISQDFDLTAPH